MAAGVFQAKQAREETGEYILHAVEQQRRSWRLKLEIDEGCCI